MAEYIDREAAIAEIIAEAEKEGKKSFNAAERGDADISVKYTHGEYCYHVAAHIAETLPPADVEPVKHGKWEFKGFNVHCSSCGVRNKNAAVCVGSEGKFVREPFKYCPDCGARMDGDSND